MTRRVLALALALAAGVHAETGGEPAAASGFPSLEEKCGKPPPTALGCKKLILGDTEAAVVEREACIADAGAYKSCFEGWHRENEARLRRVLWPPCEQIVCPLMSGKQPVEVPEEERESCLETCFHVKRSVLQVKTTNPGPTIR